jgi:hypothetical protein
MDVYVERNYELNKNVNTLKLIFLFNLFNY